MGRAGVIQPLQMSVGEKEWSITVTASSKLRFGAPTTKVPRDRIISYVLRRDHPLVYVMPQHRATNTQLLFETTKTRNDLQMLLHLQGMPDSTTLANTNASSYSR